GRLTRNLIYSTKPNLSFSCSAKLLCKSGSVLSILFPVHKKYKALQNIERFISRPDISAGTLPSIAKR
ncbi:TPA: hypothetical protein ACXYQ0_005766, partial [Klebsiella pneumoniae]